MIQKAAAHLKSVDPVLEQLIEKIGPVSVKAGRVPVFQSLVQRSFTSNCTARRQTPF